MEAAKVLPLDLPDPSKDLIDREHGARYLQAHQVRIGDC